MKKILIIDFTPFYGGGQKFIYNFNELLKNNYNLYFALSNEKVLSEINSNNTIKLGNSLWSILNDLIKINHLIKNNSIDILILNGNRPIYFSLFYNWNVTKIAYMHTGQNAFSNRFKRIAVSFLLHFSYLFIDKIVLLYHGASREIFFVKNKIRIIPNTILSDPTVQNKAKSQIKVTICCVSRIDSNKGIDWLLDCFQNVQNRTDIRLELLLAGDGPLLEQLKNECLVKNIVNVNFLGFSSNINKLLAVADIFVLPSKFESFPLSILEAMNSKLPVLATDTGGVNEIVINDYNGYIFNYGDTKMFCNKLLLLIEDKEKRLSMGENSYELFYRKFSENKFCEKITDVISEG